MWTEISLLATQSRAAEFVLIAMFARLKQAPFIVRATAGERRAIDVSAASPHSAPARPRGADVVIHLPTRAEAITFIGTTDRLDHFATNDVTEIRQAMQRGERARFTCQNAPRPRLRCVRSRLACRRDAERQPARSRRDSSKAPPARSADRLPAPPTAPPASPGETSDPLSRSTKISANPADVSRLKQAGAPRGSFCARYGNARKFFEHPSRRLVWPIRQQQQLIVNSRGCMHAVYRCHQPLRSAGKRMPTRTVMAGISKA